MNGCNQKIGEWTCDDDLCWHGLKISDKSKRKEKGKMTNEKEGRREQDKPLTALSSHSFISKNKSNSVYKNKKIARKRSQSHYIPRGDFRILASPLRTIRITLSIRLSQECLYEGGMAMQEKRCAS